MARSHGFVAAFFLACGLFGYTLSGAAPIVELVGFFRYNEGFSPGSGQQLKVLFYAPNAGTVRLRAQEIAPRRLFVAELRQPAKGTWVRGWNEAVNWPPSADLARNQVTSDNLGVVVHLDAQAGSTAAVSPAILYHSKTPAQLSDYTAYFRPSQTLSGGKYLITRGCTGSAAVASGRIGRQYARVAFVVLFALPPATGDSFALHLDVAARTGEAWTAKYCFPHAPVGRPGQRAGAARSQ